VLESQLIPGSFEHALDVLIDSEIDLKPVAQRFCNDLTGAPAYDPDLPGILRASYSWKTARLGRG
jgi:hypothetical protein